MIGNNLLITGSSRFLNPINGSCTNGTTVTTQTQSTKFMREDGTWSAPSYTAATTDKYHTTGTWSGLTYTATANGGAGALAFTIPTGTTASTVMAGNTNVNNVTQTATDSTNSYYEILFSGTADNTTRAEGARKTQYLNYNPSTQTLSVFNSNYGTSLTPGAFIAGSASNPNLMIGIGFNNNTPSMLIGDDAGNALTTTTTDIGLLGTNNTWDGTNASLKTAVTAAKGTVTQTPTDSINSTYELLFSGTADNTEHTEGTKKDNHLRYNPRSTYPTLEVIYGIPDGRSSVTAITGNNITISNNMDPGELVVSNSDVSLDLTWDGTNTSLKTAITTLADRNWYTYIGFNDKTSVAANTTVNMGSWKPTVGGVYIIFYCAKFSSNATGIRKLNIATTATGVDGMDRFGQVTVQACNGSYTHVVFSTMETVTANTTYYFNARHTASAALDITASGLKIMRIR